MDTRLIIGSLAALFLGTPSTGSAQEKEGDRKVRIDITRKENGRTSHVSKEFTMDDANGLEDALRELGVLDELQVVHDGENIVIDVKRLKEGGLLEDMSMAFAFDDAGEDLDLDVVLAQGAFLGVHLADFVRTKDTPKEQQIAAKAGARITKVVEGSPAEKAGLKSDDIVTELNGNAITSADELTERIGELSPDETVEVTYFRNGKKGTVNATLGERPMTWARRWNYAVPQEELDWDMYYGDAPPAPGPTAFLGIVGGGMAEDTEGIRIGEVVPGSAAESMGIQENDIIQRFNDEEVEDFSELAERIQALAPGASVTVDILREGSPMRLSGTLGEKQDRTIQRFHIEREDGEGNGQFFFHGIPERERDELRREMDELRWEMDRLRNELNGEVTSEMRVVIGSYTLSPEETELLKKSGVSGLENELKVTDLQLFPNPSNGFFRIQYDVPDRGDLVVDVHNASGERVYHETITGFKGRYERTLDLSDTANGTYFLVITQHGQALARKLVKQ